jgi:phosphonopyruvate decarboxylase
MISPGKLYDFLKKKDVSFFTGVPDSLLKHFLKYVQDHSSPDEHIITANEGLAVGLASGYHFATGKLPLVYLQNSGLGNLINPLTSLADKEMYSIPMLLLIGWRGKPGTKDEPQHVKMGRITKELLEVLEVPVYQLGENEEAGFASINDAIEEASEYKKPVALLVPEEIFERYEGKAVENHYSLIREEVIKKIITQLKGDETVVCTTGKIGREFYEHNELLERRISNYFLSVGAMGHASHIALGVANRKTGRTIMLDGDGALLMQMGALPVIAQHVSSDFIHIVINNGSHESVGGQPTAAFLADCCDLAKASGYTNTVRITNEGELLHWLNNGLFAPGLQFVEIRTNQLSRKNLGRPAGNPADWKNDFMKALRKDH